MSEGTTDRPPITNVYSGELSDRSIHNRGIQSCQYEWNLGLPVGTFDDLLMDQFHKAESEGRNHVTVVDVGSGNAGLFRSVLKDRDAAPHIHEFLDSHPHMKLIMVGVRHADSQEDMNTVDIIHDQREKDSQIEAYNIHYSLTAKQRLAPLLQKLFTFRAITPSVDFMTATVSLTYMGPKTFRHVVEDGISLLAPGGKFIAAKYAFADIPGFTRSSGMPPVVRVGESMEIGTDKVRSAFQRGISEKVLLYGSYRVSDKRKKAILTKTEDVLLSRGALDTEVVTQARERFDERYQKRGQKTGALMGRYFRTVDQGMANLAARKRESLKERKNNILTELAKAHDAEISLAVGESEKGENTFVIEKLQ